MKQSRFPIGWDEERVRRILAHYKEQTEEETVAEDEFDKMGTATSIYTGLLIMCLCLATVMWKDHLYFIWIINAFTVLVIILNVYLASGQYRQKTMTKYQQEFHEIKEAQEEHMTEGSGVHATLNQRRKNAQDTKKHRE